MTFLAPIKSLFRNVKAGKGKGGKVKTPLFLTENPPSVENPMAEEFIRLVKVHLAAEMILGSTYMKYHYLFSDDVKLLGVTEGSWGTPHLKTAELEQYADYLFVPEGDLIEPRLDELAQMCAGAYANLYRSARAYAGHDPVDDSTTFATVIDLFTNNLRFLFTPAKPSVVDPLAKLGFHIAYKFKFAYVLTENQ